ncbi:MAG: right-handed parallel beta-helix repeat-containing protein [Phycisphaerales bacterium]
MKPHRVSTGAALAAFCILTSASAVTAGGITPQPGDILISALDEDGFPNLFVIWSGTQGIPAVFPSEAVPALVLPPAIRADNNGASIYAMVQGTGEIAFYSVNSGGIEGGLTDTPAVVAALGFDTFDNPIPFFEDPSFGFEDPSFGFEDPSFGFSPGYINFNHPLMADDPSFDGFEDPSFGFEDPSFGFEDPLFGYTANSVTLLYPDTDDAFEFTISGPPIAQAVPYPRNWFIDPGEIPNGGSAPLADRLGGIIVLSNQGRTQGIYRGLFSTDTISSGEMILEPLYTGGVFQNPSVVIDGMHIDPVIPGQVVVTGTDFSGGRGAGQGFALEIDLPFGEAGMFGGEPGWTFRDLVVLQTRMLVIERNDSLDQSRLVEIDRGTGNRTIIVNDGQDFIDPSSIAIVVEQATESSFLDFADSTSSSSLRGAIINANNSDLPAEIYLSEGTYTLSLTGANEDDGLTGDLDIHGDIRIKGQGVNATFIDAAEIDRVFDVHPGASLLLEDLSVRNGFASGGINNGGNIRSAGTLVLIDCEIFGGGMDGAYGGGGVFNGGDFYAVRTSFRANSAFGGGGLQAADSGSTFIDRCRISSNAATGGNGGGVAVREQATASFVNTALYFNSADDFGGGMLLDTNSSVDIRYCTITRNDANEAGAPGSGFGGGIFLSAPPDLTLASTVVADNESDGTPNDFSGIAEPELNLEGYCFFGTPNDGTYTVTGDQTGTTFGGDAQLEPIIEGLFTIIGYRPASTSPLIDSADPFVFPASDQLSQPRPANIGPGSAIADIGAIERQPLPCPADVTGDGQINLADLNLVLANFGQSTSDGDTNDDNQVNLADLNTVLAAFGQACP